MFYQYPRSFWGINIKLMKMYTFFMLLLLISACKTSNIIDTSQEIDTISKVQNNKADCPENGNCTVKLHENAEIVLKKDTTEKYYPVIEKGEHIVIEYTFLVKGPEGTVDGNYSETIHFEINNTTQNLNLEGKKLEQSKLIFGKHCFCKGEAGYYKVDQGNLIVKKTKQKIAIDLSFRLSEVSHKVIRIKETIKL